MTWRDRLAALRDRLAVDADLDRETWLFAWITWGLTLGLVPAVLFGGHILRIVAFATVGGFWLGGAYMAWRKRESISVIGYE